jgi:hypothetical protein
MKNKIILDAEEKNLFLIIGMLEKINQTTLKIIEKKEEIGLKQSMSMLELLAAEIRYLTLFLKNSYSKDS